MQLLDLAHHPRYAWQAADACLRQWPAHFRAGGISRTEELRALLVDRLRPPGFALVAVDALGRFVGTVAVGAGNDHPTHAPAGEQHTWLSDLLVVTGHGGQGIARALVRAAVRRAELRGVRRLRLWVQGERHQQALQREFGGSAAVVEPLPPELAGDARVLDLQLRPRTGARL